jgi:hypothetical protein
MTEHKEKFGCGVDIVGDVDGNRWKWLTWK